VLFSYSTFGAIKWCNLGIWFGLYDFH
jgi:hypothetical protein